MYSIARKLLFCLPPETAHNISLNLITLWGNLEGKALPISHKTPDMPTKVMGLTFPNPIGLASGMDKDGISINGLGNLGFGFLELGTVTPLAQPGNPKPRLFRLPGQMALINRMGFNNAGVEQLIHKVKNCRYKGIIGINIGKNLSTSIEDATKDYLTCFKSAYSYADYIAVNISSPNTPGLQTLQFGDTLQYLLQTLKKEQENLHRIYGKYVPIAIKISPDMSKQTILEIATSLLNHGMDGVIATNTTTCKDSIKENPLHKEPGGLSGAPLNKQSTETIKILSSKIRGKIAIIGVGGIMSASDALEKIKCGANLVQLYSGFIFKGPTLIQEIAKILRKYYNTPH